MLNLSFDETPTEQQIIEGREQIAYFGRLLFERFLTDAAGGNLSLRIGNRICLSPRYAGQRYQWHLTPDDVLVTDLDRTVLMGSGQISRESNVHYALHREFGTHGTAVVHCHPRNLLAFAIAQRPLPPILEANRKFGVTPVIDFAPAHSPRLANNVAGAIRGRESAIVKQAAAVIAPWHGLFLMAKDMAAGFDAAERLDNNAYILIMSGMLVGHDAVEASRKRMEEIVGGFSE